MKLVLAESLVDRFWEVEPMVRESYGKGFIRYDAIKFENEGKGIKITLSFKDKPCGHYQMDGFRFERSVGSLTLNDLQGKVEFNLDFR